MVTGDNSLKQQPHTLPRSSDEQRLNSKHSSHESLISMTDTNKTSKRVGSKGQEPIPNASKDGDCDSIGSSVDPRYYDNPWEWTFRHSKNRLKTFGNLLFMLIATIGLPLALYYGLRTVLEPVWALLISGIPSLIYVAFTFWQKKRVDMIGALSVLAFIISGIVSVVTGDARAALLRDSAVTGIMGLLFLVTLIPIRTVWLTNRPLTFIMTAQFFAENPPYRWTDQTGAEHEMPMPEWMWTQIAEIRIHHYLLTTGWGVSLLAEFVIRVIMVEATSLSADQIVTYGTIIVAVVSTVMSLIGSISSIRCSILTKRWVEKNNYRHQFLDRQETQAQSEA